MCWLLASSSGGLARCECPLLASHRSRQELFFSNFLTSHSQQHLAWEVLSFRGWSVKLCAFLLSWEWAMCNTVVQSGTVKCISYTYVDHICAILCSVHSISWCISYVLSSAEYIDVYHNGIASRNSCNDLTSSRWKCRGSTLSVVVQSKLVLILNNNCTDSENIPWKDPFLFHAEKALFVGQHFAI